MNFSRPSSRIFKGLPPHGAGQRIGLYGGSFNPPHSGHRHVSLFALQRLRLDQIWWLVTPGNPLKDVRGLPPLEHRMVQAAKVAAHPRIFITGAERGFRTRYTADFLGVLKAQAAASRFVWVMGSDLLGQFHRWERWREIADLVPIAIINRPGHLAVPLSARAAHALGAYRRDEQDASVLADLEPPAWVYLTGPRTAASSTALRSQIGMS